MHAPGRAPEEAALAGFALGVAHEDAGDGEWDFAERSGAEDGNRWVSGGAKLSSLNSRANLRSPIE